MSQRYMIVSGPSKEWLKAVLFEAPPEQRKVVFLVYKRLMRGELEEKAVSLQIRLKTAGPEDDGELAKFVITGTDQSGHKAVAHFATNPPPPSSEIDSGQEYYGIGDLEVE